MRDFRKSICTMRKTYSRRRCLFLNCETKLSSCSRSRKLVPTPHPLCTICTLFCLLSFRHNKSQQTRRQKEALITVGGAEPQSSCFPKLQVSNHACARLMFLIEMTKLFAPISP